MKAAQIMEFGPPEVLKLADVDIPTAGPGEVLIKVAAAGINPVDCLARSGTASRVIGDAKPPMILGWDISGTIESGDVSGTGFKIGDEVFVLSRFPKIAGGYAEYAVVTASELAPKPKSIDHATAAAVPLVALTAWQAVLAAAGLQAGQKVLIHAAAGGVGHVAVQLAKWKGATVVGTGSGRNAAYLEEIGVDQIVDYTKTKFEDAVKDVDVQLDPFGGDFRARAWSVMKPNGFVVSIKGPLPPEQAAEHGVRGTNILVRPNAGQLAEIGGLIDAGKLKINVDKIYPLAEAAKAHAHVEGGHTRGKVVLAI